LGKIRFPKLGDKTVDVQGSIPCVGANLTKQRGNIMTEPKCEHFIDDCKVETPLRMCLKCGFWEETIQAKSELIAKVLEIVDKAMQMTQKTKEAYIKHGQPTTKADYEIIVWTEIRRRFEEELK